MKPAAAQILEKSEARTIACERISARPILLLTIQNGAAHTRAAEAIVEAWRQINKQIPTRIIEVSAFMSPLARFTHVSLYLWLVKNIPAVWGKIDAYQKRQPQTSPEWFYRRHCRKLFKLVEQIQPAAIVSTEVGCGEIAALIKRDLKLKIPLVAVNLDFEADRAWIQPEVDLYCLTTDLIQETFTRQGAKSETVKIWGAPLGSKFRRLTDPERQTERENFCKLFKLDPDEPIILVSGGGEGLGKIEAIVNSLLHQPIQIVVLTGRNKKLKTRCEKIGFFNRVHILGWTDKVPDLMKIADILISKLGLTFYEAMSCGLPIIALEPPPGAERIQYELLENYGVGRAVKTVEEVTKAVGELLNDKKILQTMRINTRAVGQTKAAEKLALWIQDRIIKSDD